MAKSFLFPVTLLLATATFTNALFTAPPFNLLVVPSIPSPTPLYLTASGSTTTVRSQGATCWLSPSSELYCGNFKTAIGVPDTSQATKITACTTTTATLCQTSGWKINSTDYGLSWSDAGFAWRESDGSAWAVFEGSVPGGEGFVGARLRAAF